MSAPSTRLRSVSSLGAIAGWYSTSSIYGHSPIELSSARRLLQVVEVGHVGFQPFGGSVLRIARHELRVVPRRKEIERIARIQVDELQIGLAHGQLPERDGAASEIDVVSGAGRWLDERSR